MGRLLTLILRCSPYSLRIRLGDYFEAIGEKEVTMCFLMRVRRNFNHAFDTSCRNEKVCFEHKGKRYCVRVFKVLLDSGKEEILVTNLREKHLKREEMGELYFKRWGIEVKFDSLKNKLELENMSGRRVVTTYQDFWAKLGMANTAAALEFATDAATIGTNSVPTKTA